MASLAPGTVAPRLELVLDVLNGGTARCVGQLSVHLDKAVHPRAEQPEAG
jgi:hypothetical protein